MIKKNNLSRFERHIDIPEIGVSGQSKIFNAAILIVGLGGLGCPSAIYLAAAGVGRIGLIDADQVSVSNLQRQILYGEDDVGKLKVDVASERIFKNNSSCLVDKYPFFLTEDNASEIIASYDIVLDCTDNFKTRYLLNDFCIRANKPLISGSIYHCEGQVAVFKGYDETLPCYECLYKRSPLLENIPQCKEAGVLGPLAGVIGTMQAATAINLLLEIDAALACSMMMFSALTFEIQKVKVTKRADCEACSSEKRPSVITSVGVCEHVKR